VYVGLVAAVHPRVPTARRRFAVAATAAALVVTVGAARLPGVLNDWVIPPMLLLMAYWTSGFLFVAPMPRVERTLLRIDGALRVRQTAAASPRLLAELLEIAYVAVYPVVPFALVIHVLTSAAPDAARYWTVILVTDFICFGMLPWIQTRPPRVLEPGEPWASAVRAFNLRLLGHASIQANTFPSGHAAEALAAALLVGSAPGWIVISMFVLALAISAGAVLGRYHYAADAIAGWTVAAAVWFLTPE
jgi:hypothetical protein